MGLPLHDSKACYDELRHHIGHKIVIVGYGRPDEAPENVAIECESCDEVILDFNDEDIAGNTS